MEIILKGIGVGFAVAAPVGPIGLLCIRRTLMDGRWAGLASGFGAAVADSVYGLMVATGVAATGILISFAGPMALGGGILIAGLGILSLKACFAKNMSTVKPGVAAVTTGRGLLAAFASTFALTISNPMTILTFIGLVAGLGASGAGDPSGPYRLVLGIFVGSALWWLFLVHVALAARSRLTAATTRWLDLASGLVLLVWGLSIAAGAL